MPRYGGPGTAVDFGVVIDNAEVLALLEEGLRRGADFTPPLKKIMVVLLQSEAATFAAGGRPDPWEQLKPSTIARRRKGRSGAVGIAQILQDTRHLLLSVTAKSAKDSIRIITPLMLVMGTRVSYGPKHQYGDPGGEKVTEQVKRHRRKRHRRHVEVRRTATSITTASQIVKAHWVRAHTRVVVTKRIPARPFVVVQDEDIDKIIEILRDWVAGTY